MINRIYSLFPDGTSKTSMCHKIGISTSVWNHIEKGRNAISLDVVMKVHDAFPNVSLNWLLYNDGDKYIDSTAAGSPNIDRIKDTLYALIEQNKVITEKLALLESLI